LYKYLESGRSIITLACQWSELGAVSVSVQGPIPTMSVHAVRFGPASFEQVKIQVNGAAKMEFTTSQLDF